MAFGLSTVSFILVLSLSLQVSPIASQSALSILKEIWSLSCEFTSVVSRSKRSIPQDPDLNNPTELFNYLYPLADVKLEDFLEDQKRSSSAHSMSTWAQDLVDLWHSECQSPVAPKDPSSTRSKRSSSARASNDEGNEDDEIEIEDDEVNEDEENDEKKPQDENKVDVVSGSESNGTDAVMTEIPKDVSNVTLSNVTSSKTDNKNKKLLKPIGKPGVFFTQYGGDIEYFFPVLGFGIPFDGEITFLGFHGFKGIFPY